MWNFTVAFDVYCIGNLLAAPVVHQVSCFWTSHLRLELIKDDPGANQIVSFTVLVSSPFNWSL